MPVGGRQRHDASQLAQDAYMREVKKAKNEREVREADLRYRKRLQTIQFGGATQILKELDGQRE
jgi:hypothetical protein